MPIIKLDNNTIDKIAAGEVVERPSSIVKELVENSIDANAKKITIKIELGGKKSIEVIDDGIGMIKSDLEKCIYRHATSKIKNIDDIYNCNTLGFRGEALASIAAVCKLSIFTKNDNDNAYELTINGGKDLKINQSSYSRGTKVKALNIFYNIKPRLSFLGSDISETNNITRTIMNLALSHPEISFIYIVDNKERLRTSGKNNLDILIHEIFSDDYLNNSIYICEECNYFNVKGYIGKPIISRSNRLYENTFVNGRYIDNKQIKYSIEAGYKPFLMNHKYPFVLLYFDFDTKKIDVNIHPTKSDIKFIENDNIFIKIREIISKNLNNSQIIPSININKSSNNDNTNNDKKTNQLNIDDLITKMKNRVDEKYNANKSEKSYNEKKINETAKSDLLSNNDNLSLFDNTLKEKKYKILGEVFDTYWLVNYENELLIIDQHAAHEKIIYEELFKDFNNNTINSQMLLIPVIIKLNIEENDFNTRFKDILTKYGFIIEYYGDNDYIIRGVPKILSSFNSKELFFEIIDSFIENYNLLKTPNALNHLLAKRSCKAAVKAGDKLTKEEAENIIDKMLKLDNPFNCPHGRPTIIRFNKTDLEKNFKRIV